MNNIPLNNGKEAIYTKTVSRLIPDLDPKNKSNVYYYDAPCPVCSYPNVVYSYDGRTFASFQVTCRSCGVFYRPVIKQTPGTYIAAKSEVKSQPQVRGRMMRDNVIDDKW